MKLLDFALQMEQEAANFYQKLARAASDEKYRQFFADLASDHEERMSFIEGMSSASNSSLQVSDEVCNPWSKASVGEGVAEGKEGGLVEAYRYALELETAEVHCFRDMMEKSRSNKAKRLLRTIAEEEDRHVEDFRNVYDFINAPNQYLAWAEFSNLDEFHQFGRPVG